MSSSSVPVRSPSTQAAPTTTASASAQRGEARRTFTPPIKRSGITRLSTPNFAQRPPTSGLTNALNGRPANGQHIPARECCSEEARQTPTTALVTSTAAPVGNETRSSANICEEHEARLSFSSANARWRSGVAAACQRLEQTMQETELILMRTTSTVTTSLVAQHGRSFLEGIRNPLTDPCVPTPAQTLEALQRYRGGCMSTLLELNGILTQASSSSVLSPKNAVEGASSASPPDFHYRDIDQEHNRDERTIKKTASPTAASIQHRKPRELVELQRSYRLLEERLAQTLATQAAFIHEVAQQQRRRERDGVFGEYMWTARLLVEQEAAERAHLLQLHQLVLPISRSAKREEKIAVKDTSPAHAPAAAVAVSSAAHTRRPSQDIAGMAARLTAENEALLRELHQQSSRTQLLLSTQMRDVQAAHERALAQMAARHDAEKRVWETRLDAAQHEVKALQQQCTAVRSDLRSVEAQRRDDQQCATTSQGALKEQLKTTTKKMWQLQLANDHLDAKVRVLQRELEEVRVSRSPLQQRPPSSPGPSSQLNDRESDRDQPRRVPDLIGVPAAARITHAAAPASPRANTRRAFETPIPRLPDPPVRRPMDDIRHGHPLHHEAQEGNRLRQRPPGLAEDEATVSPSVWLAYDERSLLSATTPIKSNGLSLGDRLNEAQGPLISTSSVNCAWGAPLPGSVSNSSSSSRRPSALPLFPVFSFTPAWNASALAPASTPHRRDTMTSNVSYMSDEATVRVSTTTRSQRIAARAVVDQEPSSGAHGPAPQTWSPTRRQLSLERTPLTVLPPQPTNHSSHSHDYDSANETSIDVPMDVDGEEKREEDEDGDEPPPDVAQLPRQPPRSLSSSAQAASEVAVGSPRSGPPLAPFSASTPASSRSHINSDLEDDHLFPPLTAPHGAVVTSQSNPTTKGSETDEEEAADEEEEDSAASLPPSSRERLENVRREILHHTELLEKDVQEVTARHDAAQRQRRRERDVIRVNAASLASTAEAAHHSNGAGGEGDGEDAGNTSDVDRALEQLHIAQQEDDDQLAQYYAEVNRKRGELERCLRVVEERLAPRHIDLAS